MSRVSVEVTVDESLVCLEVAISTMITKVDLLVTVILQDVPHFSTDAPDGSLHFVFDKIGRIIKIQVLLRGTRNTRS